jgi:hypothetical protein
MTTELSPIQEAAMVQAYDELPALFRLAISRELKNGRSPVQIASAFVDVVSIVPGHRAEGAKRIENAARAVEMGLVEE